MTKSLKDYLIKPSKACKKWVNARLSKEVKVSKLKDEKIRLTEAWMEYEKKRRSGRKP